tara:strand:+ start:1797 stop:2504 length:708 start_codon:yes stop_codon:yes gene_type:complete
MNNTQVVKDAENVLNILNDGGVGVIPLDVAYAIIGNSEQAIRAIFKAKNRSFEKPSGMFSNWDLFNEIQIVGQKERDIVKCVTIDNNLPMSSVAPFHHDHPFFSKVDPFVLQNSSKAGTLDMLMNAGVLHNEMITQSLEKGVPVFGSSANTSLQGSKYRLEDIEEPVLEAADIKIDYGTSKYENDYGYSSTIIDLTDFKTIRIGVCYDLICALLLEHFDIDLKAIGTANERAALL